MAVQQNNLVDEGRHGPSANQTPIKATLRRSTRNRWPSQHASSYQESTESRRDVELRQKRKRPTQYRSVARKEAKKSGNNRSRSRASGRISRRVDNSPCLDEITVKLDGIASPQSENRGTYFDQDLYQVSDDANGLLSEGLAMTHVCGETEADIRDGESRYLRVREESPQPHQRQHQPPPPPDTSCYTPILPSYPKMDIQHSNRFQDERGDRSSNPTTVLISLTTEDPDDGMAKIPTGSNDIESRSATWDTTCAPRPVRVISGIRDEHDSECDYRTERPNGIPADSSAGSEHHTSIDRPHHSLLVHKAQDILKVLERLTRASKPVTIGSAQAGRPVFTRQESTFQFSQSLALCLPPPMPADPSEPITAARYRLTSYKVTRELPKVTSEQPFGHMINRPDVHALPLAPYPSPGYPPAQSNGMAPLQRVHPFPDSD